MSKGPPSTDGKLRQFGSWPAAGTPISEEHSEADMATTKPVCEQDLEFGYGRPNHAPATLTTLMGRSFGKRYRLGPETLIGRASDCNIRLTAADASRHHARISCEDDGTYVLHDLKSHNGTRVDGERIDVHALSAGDRVAIGAETVFLFTLRSQEEEEIVEVQKMESMGQLAGGIAHDFNNLLAAIIGNSELALDAVGDLPPPADFAQECLGDVLAAANRAQDLVQQLLGFARRGNWEESPADVAAVVREVRQLLSRTFDPNIQMEVVAPPGLYVLGDRSQLFQMIMNLCLNSRDAMKGGGCLTVTAQLSDANDTQPVSRESSLQVLITVQDTGQGMDEETRERIFEPFFTTKDKGRGTGLGLAVVYGIVTSHGGRIWAESEPGVGTTFSVALPAMDEVPPAEGDVEATVLPGVLAETLRSGRDMVLVIDDEDVVRRGIGRMMSALNFNIIDAADGPTGVELFREHRARIGVVILDLVMAGMDGAQVLAVLQGIDPAVPVVIVSGYHDDAKVNNLTRAGAAGFLPKPFTGMQLRFALETALSRFLADE